MNSPDTTVRTTSSGAVSGAVDRHGALSWKGIPYAAPPVGVLRWKAPRPVKGWAGTRDASQPGPRSWQPAHYADTAPLAACNEDCLFLNVWAPRGASALLPVMLWIHGGGNINGQGDTFDGGILATRQHVVVVTINYRLGVFGWFRHPLLNDACDTPADKSGNYGTLDQIESLKWVQTHIRAFGGDPDNVTIFGESAGGANIFALLTSPLAKGLFHRAIIQSGLIASTPVLRGENYADAAVRGDSLSSSELIIEMLLEVGVVATRPEAKQHLESLDAESLSVFLYGRTYYDFQRAAERIYAQTGASLGPCLFEDGYVLPKDGVREALQLGRYHHVPVLLGSNRDEFDVLLPAAGGVPAFLTKTPDKFEFEVMDRPRYNRALHFLNRSYSVRGAYEPARWMATYQPDEIFVYRFDWAELAAPPWLVGARLGATHGVEVPFVFGTTELGPEFFHLPLFDEASRPSFEKLASAIMDYWGSFARCGDPSEALTSDLPRWPAVGAGRDIAILILDSTRGGGIRTSLNADSRRELLAELKTLAGLPGSERRQFLRDMSKIQFAFDPEERELLLTYADLCE